MIGWFSARQFAIGAFSPASFSIHFNIRREPAALDPHSIPSSGDLALQLDFFVPHSELPGAPSENNFLLCFAYDKNKIKFFETHASSLLNEICDHVGL